MEAIKDQVLPLLNRYSHIPSLSGNETEFWKIVKEDFSTKPERYNLYEFFTNDKVTSAWLCPVSLPIWVWVVHLDRVPGLYKGEAMIDTIKDHGDRVEGQLDNIISIAILKMIFDADIPVSILFTTEEETVKSPAQLIQFNQYTEECYNLITLDIDVFEELSEIQNGEITIRGRDRNGYFRSSEVQKMRSKASRLNIPFFIEEGFAAVETGFMYKWTKGAVMGNHLGIPIINYHTKHEQTFYKTIENTYKMVESIIAIKPVCIINVNSQQSIKEQV